MVALDTGLYNAPAGRVAMMDWYDRALARATYAYEVLTVPTRHGETHMVAAGPKDAPPVVLLHGMEGNAVSWRHQLAGLSADLRLYALDIIGSVGKSAPTRLPHDGKMYAEWLEDVLTGLDLDRASFVGISNGTWLILTFAAHTPDRIAKAVLMSANGIVPVRFPYSLARLMERRAVCGVKDALAKAFLTRGMVRRATARATLADAAVDPHEIEWFYLLAKYYRFRFPPGPVSDAEMAALTAPTLLLMGEREQFYPLPALLDRARRHLPNLQAEIVPGVGHNMCTDNPALINERLRQFLRHG